jgi:maltose/moltooligosaccharide transporter
MQKKLMSFLQMFNLNVGFLGIQFGWSLQMANMSGIYKFLGATEANLGYLWIAAPLTGMIIQPILGQMSDQTWVKFLGRRRPYILFGALISSIVLILMPNSFSLLMAAALLLLLDGSINIAMQPYRSLVADVAPASQHTKCYAIQTALVGTGATLAYTLPWIFLHVFHMNDTIAPGTIPLTIRLSFYIGAAVFLLANIWTVFFSKEYPPETSIIEKIIPKKSLSTRMWNATKGIVRDFVHMPKTMREVSIVQFFTWMGMFCIFLFLSLGVAQNIFGLPPGAAVENNASYAKLLEQGIVLGGVCFAIYNFVSIFFALLLPIISKRITRKGAHILSLSIAAVGLISCNFIHSVPLLFLAMVAMGLAWASIATIPYAILAGTLPTNKMGLYMGLLNITVCIPQIIAALVMGGVVSLFFHNRVMPAILIAGIFFIIAAICTLFVHDREA